jgi:hypothetical protein
MKNFSIIHDLGSLSEIERQEYLAAASDYFGLDPNLNALDLIWMDGGDGKRRLIAYARRGTTDILRGIHGINVLSITKDSGPGYVSFTAVGKNRDGRQEIAVGAASLEGLKGDRLAAAVATAQTRALRRLTLQFVGGGLLDESELNETTADINRAPASLASMATLPAPQPTVVPNAEAGKDITPVLHHDPVFGGSKFLDCWTATPEQGKAASIQMAAPEPFSSGTITPQPIPGTEPLEPLVQVEEFSKYPSFREMAKTITDPDVLAAAKASLEPKRRRRRTKAEMEAAKTEDNSDNIPDKVSGNTVTVALNPNVSQLAVTNSIPPICEIHKETMVLSFYERPGGPPGNSYVCQSCCSQRILDANIEKVTTELLNHANETTDYPTAEQEADYRKRLQTWVDVLKTAGMTGGINWRLKRYTLAMFPDAVVDNGRLRLTAKQWDTLLADFDTKQHQLGPQALVAEINTIAEKA